MLASSPGWLLEIWLQLQCPQSRGLSTLLPMSVPNKYLIPPFISGSCGFKISHLQNHVLKNKQTNKKGIFVFYAKEGDFKIHIWLNKYWFQAICTPLQSRRGGSKEILPLWTELLPFQTRKLLCNAALCSHPFISDLIQPSLMQQPSDSWIMSTFIHKMLCSRRNNPVEIVSIDTKSRHSPTVHWITLALLGAGMYWQLTTDVWPLTIWRGGCKTYSGSSRVPLRHSQYRWPIFKEDFLF